MSQFDNNNYKDNEINDNNLNNAELKENNIKKESKGSFYYIKETIQWILTFAIAIGLSLVIRKYIMEPVKVVGPSMEDTLFTGEKLIMYKLGYYMHTINRGDIVVFVFSEGEKSLNPFEDTGEKDYIKRVIGIAGDKVDINENGVFVNSVKLDEPYTKGPTESKDVLGAYPKTVPEGKIFVMGDHRNASSDSREIGFVDITRVKGRAVFRIFPFDRVGTLK